jgi:hypothetical protein
VQWAQRVQEETWPEPAPRDLLVKDAKPRIFSGMRAVGAGWWRHLRGGVSICVPVCDFHSDAMNGLGIGKQILMLLQCLT